MTKARIGIVVEILGTKLVKGTYIGCDGYVAEPVGCKGIGWYLIERYYTKEAALKLCDDGHYRWSETGEELVGSKMPPNLYTPGQFTDREQNLEHWSYIFKNGEWFYRREYPRCSIKYKSLTRLIERLKRSGWS